MAAPIESAAHYVGAGGCAAAACHGDATTSNIPSWRSSYSRWIGRRDPHSIAYAVLKSDTSKRILWLLDGGHQDPQAAEDKPWSNAAPHRDNRCLTCHSVTPDDDTMLPEALLTDGVSCEACHGPAASWIASHTTAGWLAPGSKRYQSIDPASENSDRGQSAAASAPRMWNTKDLVSRANICVRCHVGGSDRDVNHDLIAAGHPRLNFEYRAFMENLPKHWDDTLDRERLQAEPQSISQKPADYEARLWAIGQVASAHAALRLLDDRVQRSLREETAGTPEEIPNDQGWRLGPIAPAWPELAEYNCYACHHDIQAPRLIDGSFSRKRPLGSLPWGTWYFSQVQSKLLSLDDSRLPLPSDAVERVRKAMETPIARPKDVAAQLAAEKEHLAAVSPKLHGKRIPPAELERWLAAFRELPPPESWDEATQRYLALVALTNSHRKLAAKIPQLDSRELDRRLKEIRKELQFDPGYRSPAHLSFAGLQQLHERLLEVVDLLTP